MTELCVVDEARSQSTYIYIYIYIYIVSYPDTLSLSLESLSLFLSLTLSNDSLLVHGPTLGDFEHGRDVMLPSTSSTLQYLVLHTHVGHFLLNIKAH